MEDGSAGPGRIFHQVSVEEQQFGSCSLARDQLCGQTTALIPTAPKTQAGGLWNRLIETKIK